MKSTKSFFSQKRWLHYLGAFRQRIIAAELGNSSVVVAYYLLLSLFPLMITLGNVLPFLNIDPETLLLYVAQLIPANVFSVIEPVIHDLLTRRSGGLLSISALGTMWAASRSIAAMRSTMNKVYGVSQKNGMVSSRIISFGIMLLLLLSIFLVIGFFGLGQIIIEYITTALHLSDRLLDTFRAVKWPTTFAMLFIAMLFIYYLVPTAKVHFLAIIPGALFTTMGWMLLSQVFGLYARYFAKSINSYEIFGSFIVVMLWLNVAATILLLGCVLNSILEEVITNLATSKSHDKRLDSSLKK